jgi:hypothetical protein
MNPDWTDYPLSIVRDVAGHFIGRIFLLLVTLALAVFLGSGIAASTGDHLGWTGGLMIYPIMLIGGFAQGWGIPIYAAIGFFTVIYFFRDTNSRWLIFPFILQFWEAYRWSASWIWGK